MYMPQEHCEQALLAAERGDRVAVLGGTLNQAQSVLNDMTDTIGVPDSAHIRRTNGNHSIKYSNGGSIHFASVRSSLRGRAFDRVYLPISTDKSAVRDIRITTVTSKSGLLVGY